jgi:hypothetical protein
LNQNQKAVVNQHARSRPPQDDLDGNNHIRFLVPQSHLEAAALGGIVMSLTDEERSQRLARLRPEFFEELATRERTKPSPFKAAYLKVVELERAGLLTREHLEAELLNGGALHPIVDAGLLDQLFVAAGVALFNAYVRDLTLHWKQREIDKIEYRREQGRLSSEQALREILIIESNGEDEQPEPFVGFYNGFAELEQESVELPEEIIKGAPRGQVVQLVASPDAGKSTLMLNTSLMLAAGLPFPPLAPAAAPPRRVLYLDFESTPAEHRSDVKRMLEALSDAARECAMANFYPVVDAMVRGEPLTLSNRDHMRFVGEYARKVKADLIIVDTVSSAFEIASENENAEVRNRIMRPLRQLAMERNAVVMFLHHDSKALELDGQEGSYRGRGASAFGALSRAMFTLKKEPSLGDGFITLKQEKGKGGKLGEHVLEINHSTRWIRISDRRPASKRTPLDAVLDAVGDDEVSVETILERVEYHKSSVHRALGQAVSAGHLVKVSHGHYSKVARSQKSQNQDETIETFN